VRPVPTTVGGTTQQKRAVEVIIERIIERAVSAWNFLVLSKTNYYD
jgi:hypothetical protein